jgi:adenylate cyclase
MDNLTDPKLLRTEQRDVSLLFADLRGSTELSGSLHADPLVCELLANVMDCLSEAVASEDGYIVDYYGDGLVAMWNAPSNQPDHAERACRAGLRMLAALPAVSDEWRNIISTTLQVGIGVHTGSVHAGNAGSATKAKYGPRGPNVNLTSRVENATKEIGVPLLATQATIEHLSAAFARNRVCRARMPGLQPIDLYTVSDASNDMRLAQAWQSYDKALREFEQDNFAAASDTLAQIDQTVVDVPWRFLSERVHNEFSRQRRRRSTDKPAALPGGVVLLGSK